MTIIFDIERSRLSQEQACLEVAQRQQSRWAIAIINRQIDNLHFDLVEGQLCPTGPAVARHHTVQNTHTHTKAHLAWAVSECQWAHTANSCCCCCWCWCRSRLLLTNCSSQSGLVLLFSLAFFSHFPLFLLFLSPICEFSSLLIVVIVVVAVAAVEAPLRLPFPNLKWPHPFV